MADVADQMFVLCDLVFDRVVGFLAHNVHLSYFMALPQRDKLISEIQKTDLLLEYAVQHGEVEEAERLREKLRKLASMGDEEGEM